MLFDLLRVVVALSIFGLASWQDIKERMAYRWYWYAILAVAVPCYLIEFWLGLHSGVPLLLEVIGLVLVFGIVAVVWVFKLFGNGDSRALLSLALLFPCTPSLFGFPLNPPMFFTVSVLLNGLLLALSLPLWVLVYNVYREGVSVCVHNPLLVLRGYRVREYNPDMHGRVLKEDIGGCWVTATIPLIVPITGGLLIALVYGGVDQLIFSLLF